MALYSTSQNDKIRIDNINQEGENFYESLFFVEICDIGHMQLVTEKIYKHLKYMPRYGIEKGSKTTR